MAHCPYCLTPVSKKDVVCPACGAEKGYLYFNRKSHGLLFLLSFGLLIPLVVVLPFLFYFQGMGTTFWLAVTIALGLAILTIRQLFVGQTWYR